MNQKIAGVAFFLLSPLLFSTHVYAAVVINEIEPKYSDPNLAWVELYNTGSESVSLNQWKLDHTGGDAKSFILNASNIIAPHGFLTLSSSQTTLNFSITGDTIRLFDANGTQVDSQSYPATLGYNTSMGRSTDGGEGWVICLPDPYKATPNAPNNCPPAPTLTPTPTPGPTATPTPKPTAIPITTSTSVPTQQTFGSIMATPQPQADRPLAETTPRILGATDELQFKIAKSWIGYILLGVAAAALSLMLVLWLMRKKKLSEKK